MKNEFRNWSDVRIFLAVCREGSTLAASRKLGLAQPTVARRIEALESETELTLFERDTRGFKPTGAAKHLLPLAEALEAAAATFAGEANELTTAKPIRITAVSANFSPRMIDIVNDFAAQNPKVTFEFISSAKTLDLMAGEADIALRLIIREPHPDLICRKISMARWVLYAGKSYAETHDLPRSMAELEGHHFLTFQLVGVPSLVNKWLTEHVGPEQIVMSFSEVDLMHAAIKSGRGLGIMNLKMAEDDDDLLPCFEIEEMAIPHVMLISPEAYRRPEVKSFTKFFAPRYAKIFN